MKPLFFLPLTLILFSCGSEKQEFQTLPSGVEYFFVNKTNEKSIVKQGDVWNLEMEYYNSNDSLLYRSKDVAQDFVMYVPDSNSVKGSVEEGILLMNKSDSALFRVDAENFFTMSMKKKVPAFIKKGEKLLFKIKLKDIIDGKEYQKSIDDWVNKMTAQELLVIRDYIANENLKFQKLDSGVFKTVLKEGKGNVLASHKKVKINYIGHFIDGREFDNTYKRKEPFVFCLDSGKTVKGFEIGVSSMKKSEQARFVIPSSLGYGPYGRSGVIPRFATLIFDVEMIDFE